MFTVKFDTGNAAFKPTPQEEIARILYDLAARIEVSLTTPCSTFTIRDINGNTIGEATYIQ